MGPQTPFYFETGHCCQPQMAGMDHGAWKNLQTQGGLQEYFYLEKFRKKKQKEKKRSYLPWTMQSPEIGNCADTL